MAEEPTLEQTKQLQRNLTEKVLDRAASDPEWRQRLLDDSEAAMREAAFPEAEKLREIHKGVRSRSSSPEDEEVRGQSSSDLFGRQQDHGWIDSLYYWDCYSLTGYWHKVVY